MHVLKRSLLLLGVTALTLTACKDDDPVAADTIAVTSITASPPSVEVSVGGTVQVSASVGTNGGTGTIDLTVAWSGGGTIASVSSAGVVTGLVAGNTTVTATSNANSAFKASVAVKVNAAAQAPNALLSLTVNPTSAAVVLGGSQPVSLVSTLSPGGSVTYALESSTPARCAVPLTAPAGAVSQFTITTAATTGPCVITVRANGTGTGLSPNQIAGSISLDVLAQPPALLSFTATPANVGLAPGGTQVITTVVQLSGTSTVSYSATTTNASVATVTQVGQVLTINAIGNGTAEITITATGSGGGNQQNSLVQVINVNVAAASVSIASITAGGVAVNTAAVLGQIQATLNISSGNQQIGSVSVELGPPGPGGSCTVGATYVEAERQIFGVNGAPAAPVTLTINTVDFDAAFNPKWTNGPNCLRARIFPVAGATPDASNTFDLTLVNPDVVYFNSTIGTTGGALGLNHTGTSAPQVGVPANIWWKGGFTFRAHPVLYSGAANVVSITYTSTACNGGGVAAAGPTFSATFSCAAVQSTQNIANAVAITYVAGYTLTTSPTVFMTAALPGFVPGNPVYPASVAGITTREDNVAPVIVVGNVAFNDSFDQPWVNAGYAFLGDFTFSDAGVGVNVASRAVRTFGTAAVAPAQPGLGCSASNPTVVTGADLLETLTSDGSPEGYKVCATASDMLVNTNAGSAGSNFFGVDKVVPTVRLAGSTAATPLIGPSTVASVSSTANTTIYGDATPRPVMPATDVWGLEGQDTRSGFNQNAVAGFPAVQAMTRLAPLAPTSCPSFTGPLSVALSDTWVRTAVLVPLDCAQGLGYYGYTGRVVDRAGNSSTTITRNFAQDHLLAPTLSSIGLASVFYAAGAQADFTLFGSDDLEIIEGDVTVSYPNDKTTVATIEGITYPLNAVGGAMRWDGALNTNVLGGTISVPSLLARIDFTCLGAAAPYASCGAANTIATVAAEFNNFAGASNDTQNPDSVRAVAYDVASNVSNAVATGILTAQTNDVAQQWVGADLLTWRVLSTAGATVTAEHMASTSITAPYFDSVILGRADVGATEIRVCGTFTAPLLTDNGLNRFWTYSITKPTGTAQCAAGGLWYAIGVKNGAALITIGM